MVDPDDEDRSLEAQSRRNLASDQRFRWGCSNAILIFCLLNLAALGIVSLFAASLQIKHFGLAFANMLIAGAAGFGSTRIEPKTMCHATVRWLTIIVTAASVFFLLLALSD